MRILLVSSEVHPYSKTGGLADMVGALGKYLAQAGDEVAIFTPLYTSARKHLTGLKLEELQIGLFLGSRTVMAQVWSLRLSERLVVYFLEQPEFFDRPNLYTENGRDYLDNADRFIFFAKAAVYFARWFAWKPELIHLHDWQAALVPLFVADQRNRDQWRNAPRTCLTIHNLAYQGNFPGRAYEMTNLPWDHFNPRGVEFWGGLNCLKAGIVHADLITTVSPRYAREITTEAFGCGLDGVLRDNLFKLHGILNGVDYEEWTTVGNKHLVKDYDAEHLEGKTAAKLALQRELGLPEDAAIPLFGTVSRLVDQKGSDLELAALEEMLGSNLQFVLLGSGAPEFEEGFRRLARRFPEKVSVRIGFDNGLSHRIEAGCDFFLMPSKFEPCGLNQMYSLRYGTLPVVRATGGLDDSVRDPRESLDEADGIKFHESSPTALAQAIRKALALHANPELFLHFRKNAMARDFSWVATAKSYRELYLTLVPPAPVKGTRAAQGK